MVKAQSSDQFVDNFNDLSNWQVEQGSWTTQNGILVTAGSGSNRWIVLNAFNACNFIGQLQVEFAENLTTQWVGLMVGVANNSTYVWAFLYRDYTNGFSRIYIRDVSNNNILQNSYSSNLPQNLTTNTWYTLQVTVTGGNIIVTVPQILDGTYNTTIPSLLYGGFGLMVSGGNFSFKSLSITGNNTVNDNSNLAETAASFLVNKAQISDMNDPNYGGIRGMLEANGSWFAPDGYTETTGYEIQSLVNLYEATGNATYLQAAVAASDWEINVAQYMGSDLNGFGGIRGTDPNATTLHSWHTAAVAAGLTTIWQLSHNETYYNRALAALNFIILADKSEQNTNGGSIVGEYDLLSNEYLPDYLASSMGAQANFILSAFDIVPNATYLEYAQHNLDVLAASQLPNGTWWRFIYNNATALPIDYSGQQVENYAHYLMYITQALLHGYIDTGNQTYLQVAEKTWNYVAVNLWHSNGLIGYRRTEVAQFGLTSKMLYDITGNSTYYAYANIQKNALLSVQQSDGGFLNADLTEESWACKFAIDFDLSMSNLTSINTPHLIYVTSRLTQIQQSFNNEALTITSVAPTLTEIVYEINTENEGKPFSVEINNTTSAEGANWTFDNSTGLLTIDTIAGANTIETSINWGVNSSSIQSTPLPSFTDQPLLSPSPLLQNSSSSLLNLPNSSPSETPNQSAQTPNQNIQLSTCIFIIVIAAYFLIPAFGIIIFNKKRDESKKFPLEFQ